MRALRSVATIGFAFAMLGAAMSPSIAEPPKGNPHPPFGSPDMKKWGEQLQEAERERRRQEVLKLYAVPKQNGGGSQAVIGVVTGKTIKGSPPRPPTGGYDWTTPKTRAATSNQTLYKPVSSLGVKPSVTSTQQNLYKPVNSLGVKPSVPNPPQKR